jgi:predicted enzyme related to lactoylglutathione lyase
MSDDERPTGRWPQRGQIGYLQLPALDIMRSSTFYNAVFGWQVDATDASFAAPGMIGQWVTDRTASRTSGPVVWICVDRLAPTLEHVISNGGTVQVTPRLDNGERWLAEIGDPAGNRIGIVAPVGAVQTQTLLAVADVEASSLWYQQLLGFESDHGGPVYDRLLSKGVLVLQLHAWESDHDHGRIGDPHVQAGNGVLVWFGEVADFDGVVARATRLGAHIVAAPHRNPPEGRGNGPGHREVWIKDPDGYTVVIASPDGEAFEP